MFNFKEVVKAIKKQRDDADASASHCQLVETRAKALGFQSYHHLRETLKRLPSDEFGNISLKILRKLCSERIPTLDCPYFEFHALPKNKTGFYSHWIGWNKKGEEVRVPRPLEGPETARGLRDLSRTPIYVVETSNEVLAWRYNWHATALIPEHLAREFFGSTFNRSHLVEANPPIDLIRRNKSK